MDSVLYKIIEIERAAQSISDEAAKARRDLPMEIDGERERLAARIEERITARVTQFDGEEREDERRQTEALEARRVQRIAALRELFQVNRAKWEAELYENIRKK
ncbi:MAG: hypothetical protein LBH54_02460 [Clostridiales bacterium]|jgi:hypothetical protein|nr:hypothetical protein [Clostridiales bacterium]